MTEKKTFKNPRDMAVYNDGSIYVKDTNSAFNYNEWDMEVTFIKKVKPEVGGTATLENYTTIFTIIAISDGRAWLQDPSNQAQNFVRRFDQLRNVEPWRPA